MIPKGTVRVSYVSDASVAPVWRMMVTCLQPLLATALPEVKSAKAASATDARAITP